MKTYQKLLSFLALLLCGVGAGVAFFLITGGSNRPAGIDVYSYPKAKVFLDKKEIGSTPLYKEGLTSGEYTIKLIPEGNSQITPFETKIKLVPGVVTMVSRIFGNNEDSSSSQIVYLEKTASNSTSLSMISNPDSSLIMIDGDEKGVTPLNVRDLSATSHDIVISKPGFADASVRGRLEKGFDLNIYVKLAKSEDKPQIAVVATPGAVVVSLPATKSADVAKQVEILETPVGYLRVRANPTTTAVEISRVSPGEKYPLLGEEPSWYKIQIATVSGWISSQYAKLVQ